MTVAALLDAYSGAYTNSTDPSLLTPALTHILSLLSFFGQLMTPGLSSRRTYCFEQSPGQYGFRLVAVDFLSASANVSVLDLIS